MKQNPAPDLKAYRVLRVLLEVLGIEALEKANHEPQTFDRPSLLAICDPKAKAAGRDPARWLTAGTLETFWRHAETLLGRIEAAAWGAAIMPGRHNPDGGSGFSAFVCYADCWAGRE